MKDIRNRRTNSKKGVKGFIKLSNDWEDKRFRQMFSSINARCNQINHISSKYYKDRDIKNEWVNFTEFKKDMYESYLKHCQEFGEKQTSIDRIDNDKNYSKNNCRWATRKEQAQNRRKHLTYDVGMIQ